MSGVSVLVEIGFERARQDAKWGEQNHPDADPVILARLGDDEGGFLSDPVSVALRLAREYEIPSATRAQQMCQEKARQGRVTWFDILLEEVAELLEAIVTRDPKKIRDEAIDVSAVAVAWIEAIDRRNAAASAPELGTVTQSDLDTVAYIGGGGFKSKDVSLPVDGVTQ